MVQRHPFAGLGGVVDRVARFLVDIDAAGEILIALAGELFQLLRRRGAIDPGDEDALRLAFGEQLHRLIDAGHAAGKHGDAIGGPLRHAMLAVDAVGKHDEADDQQHQGEQACIEDEPYAAQEAAEPAWSFDRFLPHRLLHDRQAAQE